MTPKIDSNFADVCKKVLKSERVQTAIKDTAQEEFNELQEETVSSRFGEFLFGENLFGEN
jgi:hypothetical protein